MTLTLLDMSAFFSFRPFRTSVDALGDYEHKNRKAVTPMTTTRTEIIHVRKYDGYVQRYQGMVHKNQEHMMFLFFWLNKCIFLNAERSKT